MDLQQELTDRLVVAVEEQDILFCIFYLNEMRKENLLEAGIRARHSTRNCSAIESTIAGKFSTLRKVIIQILLLTLAASTPPPEYLEYAVECRNREMIELLKNWNSANLEDLKIPLKLLALPLASAGDVIDQTLPQPPNPSQLTGFNPLPDPQSFVQQPEQAVEPTPPRPKDPSLAPPPKIARRESSEKDRKLSISKSVATAAASVVDPPPRSSRIRSPSPVAVDKIDKPSKEASPPPSISRRRTRTSSRERSPLPPSSLSRSSSHRHHDHHRRRSRSRSTRHHSPTRSHSRSRSSRPPPPPRPSLTSTNLARVNVARFPVGWQGTDLEEMFYDIGVLSKTILCHSTYWPTYAFLDVDRDDAQRCIRLLEGSLQGDARIRCNFAGRQGNSYRGAGGRDVNGFNSINGNGNGFGGNDSSRPQIPIRPGSPSRFSPPLSSSNSINGSGVGGGSNKKNVMIVNLPYHETDEARIVVNKLRYFDLVRLSDRDQAVCWFPDTNRGEHLMKLWDDYVVDGKRLKVVFAQDGLTKEEAIEDYFKNQPLPASTTGGGGESTSKSASSSSRHHRSQSRPPTALSRSNSRSRSEHSRSSRRRSRSPTPTQLTSTIDAADEKTRDREDRSSTRKSTSSRSHKRSKTSRSSSHHRHRRSSRAATDSDDETAYGPSPPPSASNANDTTSTSAGNGTGSHGRSGSRASSTIGTGERKYSGSSSSGRRHHHHHRSDRERGEREREREREKERDRSSRLRD
ncbi:hypothetical protein JCM5350_004475 [Sporobolomyces pararoseus]